MKTYIVPCIESVDVESDFKLLSASGPDATSIGSPSVSNERKSIWDDDSETHYNNTKEE